MVIAIFHCCLETNLTEGLGQFKKKKKKEGEATDWLSQKSRLLLILGLCFK